MSPLERLKGLETFVAVVEAGSFTAAAERLHLTNSAVGKAVARLEERLKRPLLQRGRRRVELTDAGDAFYQVCVRVLDELKSAEDMLASDEIAPSGRLRVDMPATFGRLRGMASLLAFAEKHPQVTPQVSFTDRFVDLVEEGLDVVVRIGGGDVWPATLGYTCLGHEELVFCAAPSYLARRGEPRTLEELQIHDAVLYARADGSSSPWLIKDGDQPVVRQHAEGRIILGQAEAQVAAVQAGLGIAQLATWVVEQALREGSLVAILPAHVTQGLPLHIVWQRSREHSAKVRAVVGHFERTLGIGAMIDI